MMVEAPAAKIQLHHPTRGHGSPRIAVDKYEAVRDAILQVVPQDEHGLLFMELAGKVERALAPATLATLGSLGWYTTAVKLDLEARGLIERVPGVKPQRLRRASSAAAQAGDVR